MRIFTTHVMEACEVQVQDWSCSDETHTFNEESLLTHHILACKTVTRR